MSALRPGMPAPEFEAEALLPDNSFGTIRLRDLTRGQGKWVILIFYPLDFTFVCPTELTQYSDNADAFAAKNTEVLLCSVDSKFSHLAWVSQPRNRGGLGQMRVPILSDLTKSISRDYNVLIESGGDAGVSLRGAFIIDPNGVLRQSTINDLPVGRNVTETIRLLDAFQENARTGAVIPCNWTPGGRTMQADPTGSQEYFQAVHQ